MTVYRDSADFTINQVQKSYIQSTGKYYWEHLPRIVIGDEKNGYGSTTYTLNNLTNTLTNGNNIVRHDADAPRQQFTGTSTVTVKADYNQTDVTTETIRDDEIHRLADVEENVPKHLNQLNVGFDIQCVDILDDASAFTAKTFSGTGALNTYASDHNPAKDFLNAMEPLRWMQRFLGMDMECHLDTVAAMVLAGYEDFQQGATYASSGRQFVDRSALIESMKTILSLDDVITFDSSYNNAKPGLTPDGERVGRGLIWFGLVDRRADGEIIMEGEGRMGPRPKGLDGSLGVAQGSRIHIVNDMLHMKESEEMNARGGFKAFTPRYSASGDVLGFFYPATEVFT